MPIHSPLESWTGEPSMPGKQATSASKMEATYGNRFTFKNSTRRCRKRSEDMICAAMPSVVTWSHKSAPAKPCLFQPQRKPSRVTGCPAMTTEKQAHYCCACLQDKRSRPCLIAGVGDNARGQVANQLGRRKAAKRRPLTENLLSLPQLAP